MICMLLRIIIVTVEDSVPKMLYDRYPIFAVVIPAILLLSLLSILYGVKLFQVCISLTIYRYSEQLVIFKYRDWVLTLRKEEPIYSPFMFSIYGKKSGSNETISRRYTNAEMAFLHVLNDFTKIIM